MHCVIASRDSIVYRPSCFTSQCPGSTPGLAVVMRGQGDRQPGFTHGAGGRGQARQAKGCAGLRCILKRHQLQILLAAFFVGPIIANRRALWSKDPAEHRKSRGRVLHILIPPSKAAHLNTNCSCHLWWGKVDQRREFLSIMDKCERRDE